MTRTTTAERFFARPRFDDPHYVAELLNLTQILARQHAAQGDTGRYVEILREEYGAIVETYPGKLTGDDATFVPSLGFPARGVVPRADGTLAICQLVTTLERARFLANVLQQYVRWLQERETGRYPQLIASLVIALKRLIADHETQPRSVA